jgi:hypothetical protein
MKGDLYINGQDAYETWGVSLSDTGLAALMTYPPMKDYIESKSRLSHGKKIVNADPKVDERSVTLICNITAANQTEYLKRYTAFGEELAKGEIQIVTRFQPNVTYKMYYVSCSQFTQLIDGIANISLKLDEPNPMDR